MWVNKLANIIKSHNNITKSIGDGTARVISIEPLKLSYSSGKVILDNSVLVSDTVRNKIINENIKVGDILLISELSNNRYIAIDKQ